MSKLLIRDKGNNRLFDKSAKNRRLRTRLSLNFSRMVENWKIDDRGRVSGRVGRDASICLAGIRFLPVIWHLIIPDGYTSSRVEFSNHEERPRRDGEDAEIYMFRYRDERQREEELRR